MIERSRLVAHRAAKLTLRNGRSPVDAYEGTDGHVALMAHWCAQAYV